jgi:hypothetical protein
MAIAPAKTIFAVLIEFSDLTIPQNKRPQPHWFPREHGADNAFTLPGFLPAFALRATGQQPLLLPGRSGHR